MIELKEIHKTYEMGGAPVRALRGVSLNVAEGEFLAIMGPSGSGKSTLMHLIGLLDQPDSGSYLLGGELISKMDDDALATRRLEVVGFIFQQFHLLPRLSAIENVELPLIYADHDCDDGRAIELIDSVGLKNRGTHRPNELSGGQQQRVAIARALANRPKIILADEPTGNLDSASAQEIMDLLKKLNGDGITIVIVTHEEDIARQAKRLIRMRDGQIQSDQRLVPVSSADAVRKAPPPSRDVNISRFKVREMWEHLRDGFKTLAANKVRTGLSMLGILIGVAAVVAMLALGRGAQKAIEQQLSSLGSNLLMVRPGGSHSGHVALETGASTRLTIEDATSIKDGIPEIEGVAPSVTGRGQVTYLDKNWNTQLLGASPEYASMRASMPTIGRFYSEDETRQRSAVAVIGATVVRQLFDGGDPIGEMIKINRINFQVIGILPEKGASGWRDQDDTIVIPITTAMRRLMGKDYVDSIDLKVADGEDTGAVQRAVKDLLLMRHRIPPIQQQDAFDIRNMADIKAALSASSNTMSSLLAAIAAISLLVGGIGIMNIMLVSVTERTREIGLRKAIGARRFDILSQFLAESVVVSTIGGLLGILLGTLITILISLIAGWVTSISIASVLLAFFFSSSIGVIFGIYPARKASNLNPIEALRYE